MMFKTYSLSSSDRWWKSSIILPLRNLLNSMWLFCDTFLFMVGCNRVRGFKDSRIRGRTNGLLMLKGKTAKHLHLTPRPLESLTPLPSEARLILLRSVLRMAYKPFLQYQFEHGAPCTLKLILDKMNSLILFAVLKASLASSMVGSDGFSG